MIKMSNIKNLLSNGFPVAVMWVEPYFLKGRGDNLLKLLI